MVIQALGPTPRSASAATAISASQILGIPFTDTCIFTYIFMNVV
jgi:hypothetical protein